MRTPLILLSLLGVLCCSAWWGYASAVSPVTTPKPAVCVPQPVVDGHLRASQVTVNVFNGGRKAGLAREVARSLRDRGFIVRTVGNTAEKVEQTVVVGGGREHPEVLLVQSFFTKATARADRAKIDGTVDVLVGSRYDGFRPKAKAAYPVAADTVCLAPPPGKNPVPNA